MITPTTKVGFLVTMISSVTRELSFSVEKVSLSGFSEYISTIMTNFSMITEKSNKHNNFSRTDGLGVTPSVAKERKI